MKKPLDSNLQIRFNRLDLATAALHLDALSYNCTTLGQVVRLIFESGVESLVNEGAVRFADTEKATQYLNSRFGTELNRRGRGRQTLIKTLQLEDRQKQMEGDLASTDEKKLREEIGKAKLDKSLIVEEDEE